MVSRGRGLDFPDESEPPPQSNAKLGIYREGAVVSNSEPCSIIGWTILERGGSAVDAAIGTLLCEGLCSMQNMGLGGGVMMTIYERKTGRAYIMNARERAPGLAHSKMFKGNANMAASGGLSVAVPGELMGYWEAHQRFGQLPWHELFQPAIHMCRNGIPVNYRLGRTLADAGMGPDIRASPTLSYLLTKGQGGNLPCQGETIRMPELAETLSTVASCPRGAWALYDGELTDSFVEDIRSIGGIITNEDLASYRAEWMEPVTHTFADGNTLFSAPPPCAGNILVFMVSILEGMLNNSTKLDIFDLHKMAETFKFAYALRAEIGDPAYVDIDPVINKMVSKQFIMETKNKILRSNSTYQNSSYYGVRYRTSDDYGTVNIVILAPNGDAVCATSTINTLFGSLTASVSTGIILNNEMDDFCSPEIVNSFGVPPSPANFIAPRKRPLSSCCPTVIVDKRGDVRLVVGAAGGTHITTATAQVIINNLWYNYDIKQAVDFPRIHHQLLPMHLKYEYGYPKSIVEGLERLGHKTKRQSPHSCVTAIARKGPYITAIYDHRRGGSTAGR